jgi:hypothetical protein
MKVFINGFWDGFVEKTNGVHFGFFEQLFSAVFNVTPTVTQDLESADLLLESHFASSAFYRKSWRVSVFFSGEASIPLPPHAEQYTAVLGAHTTERNHVRCPLFLVYDVCKPAILQSLPSIPPKGVCAVISSECDSESRYRFKFLELLESAGVPISYGGAYKNNVGGRIPGEYYDAPMMNFYAQHRVVLALENTRAPAYITEKVLNPLRAGTVPAYYGSPRVHEYIHADRMVTIDEANPLEAVYEIKRLVTDDGYWRAKASHPAFVKPLHKAFMDVAEECKILLHPKAIVPFVIGDLEREPERTSRLTPLLTHYAIRPQAETYGDPRAHPYFRKFSTHLKDAMISLAINHITILKKAVHKNKHVLMFESDVLPLHDYATIDAQIDVIRTTMSGHGIDFVFLGKGCFERPDLAGKPFVPPCLYLTTTSRCTESYLVSPKGVHAYLEWFYATEKHDAIDWDYNYFFRDNPLVRVAWASPELFQQGTQIGMYASRVTN